METGSSVGHLLEYPWNNRREHGKEARLGEET